MGKYIKIVVVAIISCLGLLANAHAASNEPGGVAKTIRLNTPGTLLSVIPPNELGKIESLTITGYMNKADANVLTELGTNISYLNLNDCHIINSEEADLSQVCEIPQGFMRNKLRLKEIIFPKNLRSIGDFAFQDCSSLEEVILPQSLKYMNNRLWAGEDGTPFKGCTSLKKIIFNGTILKNKLILPKDIAPSLKEIRFAGTSDGSAVGYYHGISGTVSNAKVYIPASIKSDFGGTFENCEIFFESPKAPESIYYLKLHNCTIHIPKGSITSYYSKFGNLNFIESDYPQQTTASGSQSRSVAQKINLSFGLFQKLVSMKPAAVVQYLKQHGCKLESDGYVYSTNIRGGTIIIYPENFSQPRLGVGSVVFCTDDPKVRDAWYQSLRKAEFQLCNGVWCGDNAHKPVFSVIDYIGANEDDADYGDGCTLCLVAFSVL